MAAVEFGQPSSLLFPADSMDRTETIAQLVNEDAFLPTALLLQDTIPVEKFEENVAGTTGAFGGTSSSSDLSLSRGCPFHT